MKRRFFPLVVTLAFLAQFCAQASLQAADWLNLLEHSPNGTNMIALFNADQLRSTANRLKNAKDGDQTDAANDVLAEIPDGLQHAALSASFDVDALQANWEVVTGNFEKKLGTPKAISDQEGGYLDKIAGRTVIWTPRRRYLVPIDNQKMVAHIPASRSAVSQWVRSLSEPSKALPEYLKRYAERTSQDTAVLVAVEMADVISPVQAVEKVQTLKSVKQANIDPEQLGKLLGELKGITFSVTAKNTFFGELRLEFESAPTLLRHAGRDIIVEACSRRGVLFAEMREWNASVEGKSFVLNGPFDAISVVNLLAFFKGIPANSDYQSSEKSSQSSANSSEGTAETVKASKRYFSNVQRVLKESRNTKGLSVAQRGAFNDRLSHKIDDFPILNVDPDLLSYGQQVAELIRGAAYTIRSANVGAGGQKATQATSTSFQGSGWRGGSFWGGQYGSYSFNDNTAYNESLSQAAHAEGMQAHLTNMQQVDTLTQQIRREMTERYKTEF